MPPAVGTTGHGLPGRASRADAVPAEAQLHPASRDLAQSTERTDGGLWHTSWAAVLARPGARLLLASVVAGAVLLHWHGRPAMEAPLTDPVPTHGVGHAQCDGWCWRHERLGVRSGNLTKECLAEAASSTHRYHSTPLGPRQVDITHVFNPFPGAATKDLQYRWTMDSIAAAKAYAAERGVVVEALAVYYADEVINVPPHSGIRKLPVLCPERRPPCHTGASSSNASCPLFSDIANVGYAMGRGRLLVYTNLDIILETDFYTRVHGLLGGTIGTTGAPGAPPGRRHGKRRGQKPLQAVSLTRRDMRIPLSMAAEVASWRLKDIFRWNETSDHPGTDCLVFPRAFLPCLDIASLHLGIAGWGALVLQELRYLAQLSGGRAEAMDYHATRHLGRKKFKAKQFVGAHSFRRDHDNGVLNTHIYGVHKAKAESVRSRMAASRTQLDDPPPEYHSSHPLVAVDELACVQIAAHGEPLDGRAEGPVAGHSSPLR